MTCGSLGCVGTELRIMAEPSTRLLRLRLTRDLSVSTGQDMDY